jgi:hypothetical protein
MRRLTSILALFVGGWIVAAVSSVEIRAGQTQRAPAAARVLSARARRSVLHHLPQPETSHRRARPRHARSRASEHESRSVGARDRQAACAIDAAARPATSPITPPIERSPRRSSATSIRRGPHIPTGTIGAVHRLNRTEYTNVDSRPVRARPRRSSAAARRRDG